MSILGRIRLRPATLSRVNLGLFVLVWVSIVMAPCAMAMHAGAMPEHDCPRCTFESCAEIAPPECDTPDSLDSLRTVDKTETIVLLPPRAVESPLLYSGAGSQAAPVSLPPVRAGPRPHLVHVQFNE